ncbi:carbohydrate ABC transporter permease [Cohnella thailandensis]|uniref:Sugar ABC transporter permease n=1 Tax=Cohnella thailandensis TaxID=557557 RepID=A0A841SU60_9BACL|nr:sugar ABC transporter permease [Cohnella thailandensis]MBB6633167.1 sugar ABC transporter permease [Cohnella thailandensis]MBP1975137.1 multiple sugar transport system permease protein [Cohnella thailandensis]
MSFRRKRKIAWTYLFLAPQFVLLAAFTVYPILMSYVYSLYDWSGIGPLNDFVGLSNFRAVLEDSSFWNAFRNNMIYMFFLTVLSLPTTFVAALVLNLKFLRGRTAYRTLLFLPVVTTAAIIGIVLKFIFGNDNALFNNVLISLGILKEPVGWLADPTKAMIVLIAVGVWKLFGMIMIYWLAGLQSLPSEVFDAAKMDGAGYLATVRYLTVPLLLPVATVILLLTALNGMHVFDMVTTLTGGGPYFATDMVDLYIYRYVFASGGFPQMGYASAAGIIFGLSIFALSVLLGGLVRVSGGKKAKSDAGWGG